MPPASSVTLDKTFHLSGPRCPPVEKGRYRDHPLRGYLEGLLCCVQHRLYCVLCKVYCAACIHTEPDVGPVLTLWGPLITTPSIERLLPQDALLLVSHANGLVLGRRRQQLASQTSGACPEPGQGPASGRSRRWLPWLQNGGSPDLGWSRAVLSVPLRNLRAACRDLALKRCFPPEPPADPAHVGVLTKRVPLL